MRNPEEIEIKVADWRPIAGCSPISPGCANCVGMKGQGAAGFTVVGANGPAWTGETRLMTDRLMEPDRLPGPTWINVCANGDLFHENSPDGWIDAVFDVIDRNPRHGWSILTKRARRMADYLGRRFPAGVPANIHVGVSAERQIEADARIADLLGLKAATRFVFFYPLLERVDAAAAFGSGGLAYALAGDEPQRPADPRWFEALNVQADAAGVPFEINSDVMAH